MMIASLVLALLCGQIDLDAAAARIRFTVPRPDPLVLAFYYPWYGNAEVDGGSGTWSHWGRIDSARGDIESSRHYPSLGPYDSQSRQLLTRHGELARRAGLDGLVVSWWGFGSFSDRAMPGLLEACRKAGLVATVYYETVPEPRTVASAVADIEKLVRCYGSDSAWLRVGGRPVIFVYGRAVDELGLAGWLEARTMLEGRVEGGLLLVGDGPTRASAMIFDGIHAYNPAGELRGLTTPQIRSWARETYHRWVGVARRAGRIASVTVIPGYDDTKIRRPGLRVDRARGETYRILWEEALAAVPDWIVVTSWNEWHEGSEIEPSRELGARELQTTTGFAARFHAVRKTPPRGRDSATSKTRAVAGVGTLDTALIERLEGKRIGILPEAGSPALWWLLEQRMPIVSVSYERLAGGTVSPDEEPILVWAGGESFRPSVRDEDDVVRSLAVYLHAGGILMVLPGGPVPFYYDLEGRVVAAGRRLGVSLGVSPGEGGWEQPPSDALHFRTRGAALPHLDRTFQFPTTGDRRWRPFLVDALGPDVDVETLVCLEDEENRSLGPAVVLTRHSMGGEVNSRVVSVWFRLLDMPQADRLLGDLFNELLARMLE